MGWFNWGRKKTLVELANELDQASYAEHGRQRPFSVAPPAIIDRLVLALVRRYPRIILSVHEVERSAIRALGTESEIQRGLDALDTLDALLVTNPTRTAIALAP